MHLIAAESDQRGYVLTGQKAYLLSYNTNLVHIRNDLNDLGRLALDNPQQQQALQELRPLIAAKLSEFHEALAPGNKLGIPTVFVVRDGTEIPSLLEIISRVTQMKEEERRLRIQRSQTAQAGSSQIEDRHRLREHPSRVVSLWRGARHFSRMGHAH